MELNKQTTLGQWVWYWNRTIQDTNLVVQCSTIWSEIYKTVNRYRYLVLGIMVHAIPPIDEDHFGCTLTDCFRINIIDSPQSIDRETAS